MRIIRSSFMVIIGSIIAGYLLLLALMFIFQNNLIFLPSPKHMITPERAGLNADDIWIKTRDDVQLHGWYFPNDEARYVVILSHGNAGNISNRIDIAKLLQELGVSVVLYDYRGYGQSSGKPTEEGLYKDIEAVVDYLKTEKGYSEQEMIMYGRSLGGAVASYAATRFNVSGLVLDSTFKNLKAMVGDLYPFVPAALARYEFSTEVYLQNVPNIPVMVMHSSADDIVDISHAKHLYKLANEPKRFVELRGGHNENFHISTSIISRNWKEFLQSVEEQRKLKMSETGN